MVDVEKLYQDSIDRMSPKERVARAIELFNWSREFIGRQVCAESPGVSPERAKLLVALRMYGNEPEMKRLIEGLLANVSD